MKKGRESYLVIEEIDRHFEVTRAAIDHFEKKIFIEDRKIVDNLGAVKRRRSFFDKIILGLDSGRATTIESDVTLKRIEALSPISDEEIDSLVFRGLWQFLNHYRAWTAKKMGISELDLVLANAEISDVRLGGHRVFNPVGFSSKDFFLKLRGTFVPRSLLPSAERLKKMGKEMFVFEEPSILTASLCRDNDFAVHVGREATTVFIFKEDERLFLKTLPFGSGQILGAIARGLGVDEEMVVLILDKYSKNHVSERFKRVIERHFREQFKVLLDMIRPLYSKVVAEAKPVTYFSFRFTAPIIDELFSSSRVRLAALDETLRAGGYDIIISRKVRDFSPKLNQSTLAFLTFSYEHPQYNLLNQLLRRRAKWLIPNT
jgi:hypothetical protein